MKKSLVYTKTGDRGLTSLIGGTRVPKHHERLEAYGCIDELNSFVGLIRSFEIEEHAREVIIGIQNNLFVIGAYLATDTDVSDLKERLASRENDIELLEREMDILEAELPPMTHFVLPGGDQVVAYCHIARTVCRRAERRVNALGERVVVDGWVSKYLNRLSDYLFVLSRRLSKNMNVHEIPWKPEL